MKRVTIAVILVLASAFGVGIVSAASQGASIDKGKALFNDPKLGTNGKTCNTCHPNGKGLEKAGEKSDLEGIINGCITIPLKGKALDPKSVEMQSLVLYVKSLGSTRPAATQKPAVGC